MAVLLNLTEFPGVNTNSPRGTVPAPDLLLNVNMDRTGGYTGMYERSAQATDVAYAVSSGYGNGVFVSGPGGTRYDPVNSAGNVIWDGSLKGAVLLMPGLIAVGTQRLTYGGLVPPYAPPTLAFEYVNSTTGWAATDELEWLLEFENGGTQTIRTGAGHGTPPEHYALKFTLSKAAHANIYGRNITQGTTFQLLHTLNGTVVEFGPGASSGPSTTIPVTVNVRASTYHQGRVYVTGGATWQEVGEYGMNSRTDSSPQRVWYSDVIAGVNGGGRIHISPLGYFDVPFRTSENIVALTSVGAYLYIFGDRELWVMTGDPAYDARLESIGDSIGAVSGSSVQQLSGVVYWQSDSGVLAVQGGQVMEVGAPVRDQLITLGLNVTATVDFKREQYILTDGATILVYHAREKAWTTRAVEGSGTPKLLYGGGTPYMVQGSTLYSIGGEAGLDGTPPRLDFTVRFPPYELGDWRAAKSFEGITFGLDLATQGATVTHRSTVDGRTDQTADTHQTVTAGRPGAVKVRPHRDGIGLTGAVIALEFKVSTQDSRGIMRPPLMLHGTVTGETPWEDDQDGI